MPEIKNLTDKNGNIIYPRTSSDAVNVSGDTLTNILNNKVNKEDGKVLSSNDYTTLEKEKLANLENYVHPATHNATMITEDENHRFVSDIEKTTWNNKSTFSGNYNDLVNKPTRDFIRDNDVINYDINYLTHDGFNNFSKKTYGRYEQGTVMSVIANVDSPRPELTGTDTHGLGWYPSRDSCSLYVANSGAYPVLQLSANTVTYNSNGCILPDGTDMNKILIGMILDTDGTVNDDWYVGIVKEINGYEIILEDGWYTVRNDGVDPTKVTPTNNLGLKVSMTTKIWNINSNMFVNNGLTAGANMELGVICNYSTINDVGGIDLINLGSNETHYGIKVRGKYEGFLEGFISDINGRHFVAFTNDDKIDSTPLLRSNKKNGSEIFSIMSNGELSKIKVGTQILTNSGKISSKASMVFVTNAGVNVTLPDAEIGKIVKIMTTQTDTLLTASIGIVTTTLNQQQISIGKTEGRQFRSVELISDGNVWYVINDIY